MCLRSECLGCLMLQRRRSGRPGRSQQRGLGLKHTTSQQARALDLLAIMVGLLDHVPRNGTVNAVVGACVVVLRTQQERRAIWRRCELVDARRAASLSVRNHLWQQRCSTHAQQTL